MTTAASLLALTVFVQTAGATDPCDIDCQGVPHEPVIVSPLEGATVPVNVRVLASPEYSSLLLVDISGNPVTLTSEPAPGGLRWLVPDVDLEPNATYRVVTGLDPEDRRPFKTGDGRDDEAPQGVTANVEARHSGCVDLLRVRASAANDDQLLVELVYPSGPGEETAMRAVGPAGTAEICRYGGGEFSAKLKLYDLAGNATAPFWLWVTPTSTEEQDSGCSVGHPGRPQHRSWVLAVLALACIVRRHRCA